MTTIGDRNAKGVGVEVEATSLVLFEKGREWKKGISVRIQSENQQRVYTGNPTSCKSSNPSDLAVTSQIRHQTRTKQQTSTDIVAGKR